MLTAQTIVQSLASGLLMGLLYGLIAVGLALIFGLMDVVNFAHGEFLMAAMYATFGCAVFLALDPLLAAPLVAAALFAFGALVYLGVVRFAMRAKTNAGMVQIFATFGLAIVMRGLAQWLFTPDYRSIPTSWIGNRTVSIAGIFLPLPQLVGALVAIAAFAGLYLVIRRTDFGRALEATREDAGAVALVGIDRNRVFAFGWRLAAVDRARRLCPRHPGVDADVCGAFAELEHPQRLLWGDFAWTCAVFWTGCLYQHHAVHQVRCVAVVRNAWRRRALRADRASARLSLLPFARPLFRDCDHRDRRNGAHLVSQLGLGRRRTRHHHAGAPGQLGDLSVHAQQTSLFLFRAGARGAHLAGHMGPRKFKVGLLVARRQGQPRSRREPRRRGVSL